MVLFNLNDMSSQQASGDSYSGYPATQRNAEGQLMAVAKPVKRLSAHPWPFSVKTPEAPRARSAVITSSFVT